MFDFSKLLRPKGKPLDGRVVLAPSIQRRGLSSAIGMA